MGADKGPEHFDDDEYHLEDEQFDDENHPSFDEEPPKKKKSWRDFIGKRVIIILGIIVAIIIVYKFLGARNESTQQADLGLDQQQNAAATHITAAPVNTAVQNQQTAQNTAIQAQVQSLSEQNARDTTQLQSIQSDVTRLNDTMNQLQLSLNTLNQSLASLSGDVSGLKAVPEKTVCGCNPCASCGIREPVVKRHTHRRYYGPGVTYHLKAVVPGRAWIQSTTGLLTTVKVGDSLSGYGVVKAINATQGWVGTSSGRVIQYGPYDS